MVGENPPTYRYGRQECAHHIEHKGAHSRVLIRVTQAFVIAVKPTFIWVAQQKEQKDRDGHWKTRGTEGTKNE